MTVLLGALTRADAAAYAHAHVVMLEATYAHLVGPEFAALRWAELDERVAGLEADLATAEAAVAAGRKPPVRHLVARNGRGTIVGVGCVSTEVGAWEETFLADAWVPPAVTTNLAHLYLMPGVQGSGLAQRLLDVLLPQRAASYLWVMTDNARAVRFYERNGYVPDLGPLSSGPTWGRIPMMRMLRGASRF